MPVYELRPNRCNCHWQTCSCDPWLITRDGERYTTIYGEDEAREIVAALNTPKIEVEVRLVPRRRPPSMPSGSELHRVDIKLGRVWVKIGTYNTLPFARKVKAAIEKGWEA